MSDTSPIGNQSEKISKIITLAEFSQLVETLPEIPEPFDHPDLDVTCFVLPHIHAIAQSMVDLIQQQLDCRQVLLASLDLSSDRCYLLAASGLSPEQLQQRQKIVTEYALSTLVGPAALDMLQANQVVVLSRALLPIPDEIRKDFGQQVMLLVPLIAHKRLLGGLLIGREGTENAYTQDEITLVKAIAKLVVLTIGRVQLLGELTDAYVHTQSVHEINQRMNEFLNMVSHELKTPLTTVLGNLQIIQRRVQRWKGQIKSESKTILQHIERIEHPLQDALLRARFQQNIIDDMLDDSCIQRSSLILHMKTCNLIEIVREEANKKQKEITDLPIQLEGFEQHENIPIVADARRIKQVITNYLINALKYSSDDQPIRVQITVDETTARVAVQDAGPGIPPEEQKHIWERFYRAKGIAVQHELDLSMGLGLYICDNIMRLHHGKVGVDSSPGHGSTFWLTIPILEPPA
ncbi:GAF domain-containing sensor histidine kinase [Dictyobacter arantiisoli]|uniref:histidine kinase n=1 Tax=Dictyobacter arantiisoli TaxID=2014874 RepID=A0A5A5T6I8_9CHLR|nr:HAMP domain-containing sensor histidine kinase [Dictyobacter arantiisoli]GCF06978.1 hypothetical protein KDI_05420 [Dictyobacter arantiisoli]